MTRQEEIREWLAELEHEQWAYWTRYMLDNLSPENIERWRKQIETSYSELTEKERQSDRKWADATLKFLRSKGAVLRAGYAATEPLIEDLSAEAMAKEEGK